MYSAEKLERSIRIARVVMTAIVVFDVVGAVGDDEGFAVLERATAVEGAGWGAEYEQRMKHNTLRSLDRCSCKCGSIVVAVCGE